MDEAFREWAAWREATRDEPLEGMVAFFDARVGDYEAHMARWGEHYRWMPVCCRMASARCWTLAAARAWSWTAFLNGFPTLR